MTNSLAVGAKSVAALPVLKNSSSLSGLRKSSADLRLSVRSMLYAPDGGLRPVAGADLAQDINTERASR